jgi:hypothetical protein
MARRPGRAADQAPVMQIKYLYSNRWLVVWSVHTADYPAGGSRPGRHTALPAHIEHSPALLYRFESKDATAAAHARAHTVRPQLFSL